jgi:hypothetical protein
LGLVSPQIGLSLKSPCLSPCLWACFHLNRVIPKVTLSFTLSLDLLSPQ